VCTEEMRPSDVILVENFDPHYLVFERAAAHSTKRAWLHESSSYGGSRDSERANPVSQGMRS